MHHRSTTGDTTPLFEFYLAQVRAPEFEPDAGRKVGRRVNGIVRLVLSGVYSSPACMGGMGQYTVLLCMCVHKVAVRGLLHTITPRGPPRTASGLAAIASSVGSEPYVSMFPFFFFFLFHPAILPSIDPFWRISGGRLQPAPSPKLGSTYYLLTMDPW